VLAPINITMQTLAAGVGHPIFPASANQAAVRGVGVLQGGSDCASAIDSLDRNLFQSQR
jgi:hypothetical protein